MRKLSDERMQEIHDNFIGTLDLSVGEYGNLLNMLNDAKAFKWPSALIKMLKKSIFEAFN